MIKFSFTDEEIQSACKELGLPENTFEDKTSERRKIIDCWNDANIIACPGSGKTTVLLVKLLLLSQRMPFEDGSGICVLTHTNVAIDEIKNRLGNKVDLLFKYPNFFGTIQSFVDKFLALPAFRLHPETANSTFIKFDNGTIKKLKINAFYNIGFGKGDKKTLCNYLYGQANQDPASKKLNGKQKTEKAIELLNSLEFTLLDNIIRRPNGKTFLKDVNNEKYQAIRVICFDIWRRGILSFDDAFNFANWYLTEHSILIKNIISKRFSLLFADEMQDTQLHQMDIISSVFNEAVTKQYFGDPDQAIFNGFSDEKSAWRDNIVGFERLAISDSKRFGNEIAACINPFKQVLPSISGNTQKQSLQPTILLFDQSEQAVGLFVKQIHNHKLLDNDWRSTSARFNLVGSVGKAPAEDTKLTINSYVPNYSKEATKRKTNFDNLISYFQKRPAEETKQFGTKVYYELFVNALVAMLNLMPNNQYTKSKLLAELKENNPEFLTAFNLFIFNCIQQIETDTILPIDVKTKFINLLTQYNYQIPQNTSFINENQINSIDAFTQKNNVIVEDGIEIKVGTIHSIKGETHMATLLVENENYGASESSYFWDHKSGNDLFCPNNTYKRPKTSYAQLEQRLKTTYVAMSRPTHLLCVAVQKSKASCPTCQPDKKASCKWKVV
ncbi:UvrD-helicase domain-containing protein [Pseudoalteromonas sp. SR44-5]|uniref:UvrD-helicase domain-containing protein n=1 Tax=unclassified Pseudoalteromonas TaxID=194690 RepID=UPI0015FF98DE|nr:MULTISPECIES: UvrD-helicase domain-containing protein [unclassified Pseudoalteromonas]MBB1365290.1 UvrD-helicase domain-containing protein [Pseudoalteromonas sp. SR44-5]MBB1416848.1 UvrD-helicase domain-containing protein [Pseudoalteromonas sp. SG44-1]